MNTINKTVLTFLTTCVFAASSSSVFAEATVVDSSSFLKETITHVEQGLIEVNKSDFAAANLHLKAAVAASDQIKGNEAIVKEARTNIVQGNSQSKQGEVEQASKLLNKGLELYKSL